MISSIENLEQLIKEKKKLQLEVDESKASLMNEVFQLEQSLSPGRIVVDVAKSIISPPHGFAGNMITNIVGTIASKTLFSGFGWPIKWILTAASKNFAGNYLEKNGVGLVQSLVNYVSKKKATPKLLAEHNEKSFDR